MQISTHHPGPSRVAACRVSRNAPFGTGQRKTQNGGKQNGGSTCNLKMTSFEQIVRVADGQIHVVPDPFVNTKTIILLRQGETCFRLNTEAKET